MTFFKQNISSTDYYDSRINEKKSQTIWNYNIERITKK